MGEGMTEFDKPSFSVYQVGTETYRQNWEATFGKVEQPEALSNSEASNLTKASVKETPNASIAEQLGDTRACPMCGVGMQYHELTTVDGVLLVHCRARHGPPTMVSGFAAGPGETLNDLKSCEMCESRTATLCTECWADDHSPLISDDKTYRCWKCRAVLSAPTPSGSLDAIGILTRDRDEWKRRALSLMDTEPESCPM